MRFFSKNNSGFTLIELILYVALSSLILLVIAGFLGTVLNSRVKNTTINEVEQQGVQVMQLITQTIRNALSINSPTPGTSDNFLSLNVTNPADSPTIFNLIDGLVQIKEGANTAVPLMSSLVEVTNLKFDNLSNDNTSGIIRIEFTIKYKSDSIRQEYQWQKTFYASASLR